MGSQSENNILFVFEGKKTEPNIHEKLKQYFFDERTVITCVFGTVIYSIYKDLETDGYLDTFSLLKNRIEDLKKYKKKDFSEIYLFFDCECHATNYSPEKLKKLLSVFDNETESGKLYISYPMVEALKHYHSGKDFQKLTVHCSQDYKREVNQYCEAKYIDFNQYDESIWKELIKHHLSKMNYIVADNYSYPSQIYSQIDIFNKQKEKFINKDDKVSVLSAFPIFIHDYFGNEKTKQKIKI
ncbi:hypothetical protein [Capnocytophaga sp. H2931]|uniref:hypothetical protein n=1 Tax=Capnocytophaga sp. H2931 TaxID=1945657 RepID=UPI000BB1785F|nr:hypothetical protein [Capnocytophaga sp. H2931]ATA75782.1 hypothetical protein CGC52_10340 [Capnocytophaga sp. H2931]